jgi:cysteine synthase A
VAHRESVSLEDIKMIVESPLELIFRDLFYRLRSFAGDHDVFLKLEGFNVTGSIKVKTAIGLVEDLERRGLAQPNKTVIIESSSGNLGIALSLVCAVKGYRFICVTDPNANAANVKGMELYGAEVIVVEERDAVGGYLGSRLKAIDQLLQSEPHSIWLNQYANIANKNLHAEQTAAEIAREFDKVDWVFVGAGTTGTLAGVSERLRQEFPNIKIVAVEPAGSVTFGGAPGKRSIPGIGTSVRPKLADLANPHRIVTVSEPKTVESCLAFVRDYHLLVGGSTGSVLAGVQQLASEFKPGDTIVAISPDLGDKYLDTVYDPAWVKRHVAPESRTSIGEKESWQPRRRSSLYPAPELSA